MIQLPSCIFNRAERSTRTADGTEAEKLRQVIKDLEARIKELTEFKSDQAFHSRAGGEP